MQSDMSREYPESGFPELRFLNGFTGNIDRYIDICRGIDAVFREFVEAIDAEPKITEA